MCAKTVTKDQNCASYGPLQYLTSSVPPISWGTFHYPQHGEVPDIGLAITHGKLFTAANKQRLLVFLRDQSALTQWKIICSKLLRYNRWYPRTKEDIVTWQRTMKWQTKLERNNKVFCWNFERYWFPLLLLRNLELNFLIYLRYLIT